MLEVVKTQKLQLKLKIWNKVIFLIFLVFNGHVSTAKNENSHVILAKNSEWVLLAMPIDNSEVIKNNGKALLLEAYLYLINRKTKAAIQLNIPNGLYDPLAIKFDKFGGGFFEVTHILKYDNKPFFTQKYFFQNGMWKVNIVRACDGSVCELGEIRSTFESIHKLEKSLDSLDGKQLRGLKLLWGRILRCSTSQSKPIRKEIDSFVKNSLSAKNPDSVAGKIQERIELVRSLKDSSFNKEKQSRL